MLLLNLKAIPHPGGNRIDLSWEFPELAASVMVRVVRREDRYPRLEDWSTDSRDKRFVLVARKTNLRTVSDKRALKAGHVYYYAILIRAHGETVYRLDLANCIAAMATGPFDMAGQMYGLLPGIYKRYDTRLPLSYPETMPEVDRKQAQLRRFMSLPGGQLDQLFSFAEALLLLREPDRVDGRLLPLLAEWIGWHTDYRQDFQTQRNEVRLAPFIQETIGTLPNVEATVKRLIQWDCRAKEFVNNIFVSNQPERLNLWVMRLNGQAAPDPAELLSLDFAYEGRPSAIVSNGTGDSTQRWLFYHSPLSSGVETTCPLPPRSAWTILYKTMLSFRISTRVFASVLERNSISSGLLQQFAAHGLRLSYELTLQKLDAASDEEPPNTRSWLIIDNKSHSKYKIEETGDRLTVSTEWSEGRPLAQGQDTLWQRHPSAVNFSGNLLVFWDVYDSATASWFIETCIYRNGKWMPQPVFNGSQNNTDRRSPHAVIHDGQLWLFWQERLETGWRLKYLKTPAIDVITMQTPEDFPGTPLNQAVKPAVEDDFFAVSDPEINPCLRFFWSGRVNLNSTQGSMPSGQSSHQTRRHLFQRSHDGANWSDVKAVPNAGDADDRDPMAMVADGKLELCWSSNRDGNWSIWRSELDRNTEAWLPARRLTTGLYDQRTPLLLGDGEETLLFYRSAQAIIRTSPADSATYTLDTRYSGCTMVNTRNRQRIGMFKMYEDFTCYTYDTGPQGKPDNTTWYTPNTVGLYLRAIKADTPLNDAKRQLAREFLQAFLPIQVRLVFIIETSIVNEEVYSVVPLAEETWFILKEGASEEFYPGLVEDEGINKVVMRGWAWVRTWEESIPPQPVQVTNNPHFRTWHIDVTTEEE